MADDKNQQPEESFKDKILRSLHENDDDTFKMNPNIEKKSEDIVNKYQAHDQATRESDHAGAVPSPNSETASPQTEHHEPVSPAEFSRENKPADHPSDWRPSPFAHRSEANQTQSQQPPYTNDQSQRPPYGYGQSQSQAGQPPYGNDQSPDQAEQSPYGYGRSQSQAGQPPYSNDQSPDQAGQSPYGYGQSQSQAGQPPYSNDQSPYQPEQPPYGSGPEGASDWQGEHDTQAQAQVPPEEATTPTPQPSILTSRMGPERAAVSEMKRSRRKKEDKLVSRIVLIVISTLVVIGIILGVSFYNYVQASLKPLDAKDEQLVQVEIPSGSTNKVIGEILEKEKIIKSGIVFNYYTKFNNLTDFQSGYYQMAPNMTLDEISSLLQEGGTAEPVDIADAKVTIPEGYDVSQIADQIEEASGGKITAADFKALLTSDEFFQQMLAAYPQLLTSAGEAEGVRYRLEGYLFPATYDYYAKTTTAENLAEQMVAKTDSVLSGYYEQIQNQGYSVQQVLTLASLVEKEGVTEDDRKNIAQVFLNRVNHEMPLQSDISILYALDTHKELVTYEDLEVDSPYNLYKNTGYGPGPFNSPSETALQAVLDPNPNDYLYFVADLETGKVYFATTYEEHMELVEKYVNNEKNE